MRGEVYLALYKGNTGGKGMKSLWFRFLDFAVRKLTRGRYSHCELAFPSAAHNGKEARYICYSASLRDGGVRKKIMPLPADKWDLLPLDRQAQALQGRTLSFFSATQGRKYDYLGAIGVLLGFGNRRNRWFCSEWCAAVLGFRQPERYSPAALALRLEKEK